MNKGLKRIISILLLSSIVITSLVGCNKGENAKKTVDTKRYSKAKYSTDSEDDGVVCENDSFSVNWDDNAKRVSFTDKKSGEIYSTTPTSAMEKVLDQDGLPIKNNPQIESPIIVYYYDPTTLEEKNSLSYVDAITDGDVYSEKIDNGIKVRYDFKEMKMSVAVDYTIDDEKFNISVNPKEIYDDGKNVITGVALAPFICGLKNDSDNSYLFIPDGSGALINPVSVSLIGNQGSIAVYGDDASVQSYYFKSFTKQVNLPVYGAKNGDNAICGIINSGASQAEINWSIGSQNIKYSTVYPFFRIRGYSLLEAPDGFSSTSMEVKVFDTNINTTPLSVSFYPLHYENASYVGMANKYREYLEKTYSLKKTETTLSDATVKIIGGFNQKAFTFGIPHTSLLELTTVKQAEEIVKYFNDKNCNITYDLVGFGNHGLDLGKVGGGFKPSSALGNTKDLKNLNDTVSKNKNTLFIDYDVVGYTQSGSGFSKGSDSAKRIDGQNITKSCFDNISRKPNGKSFYLLSRDNTTNAIDKIIKSIDKTNINGVGLDSLSHVKYSDYSNLNTVVCGNMSSDVVKAYQKLKDSKKKIASNNANDYAACLSDIIMDTPISSSRISLSTYDVPFYQIVFHGYVPMSSTAVNLSEDDNSTILKCVEAGISPNYSLFYEYSNTALSSTFSFVYGCDFKGYRDEIVNNISKLSSYFKSINNTEIKDHQILGNGLRVTTFDNGVKAVVNETELNLDYQGQAVPAQEYIILEAK